jgi:hypothetical protein
VIETHEHKGDFGEKLSCMRQICAFMAYVKNRLYADVFLAYKLFPSACVIAYEEETANDKIQKAREQTEAQPDGA